MHLAAVEFSIFISKFVFLQGLVAPTSVKSSVKLTSVIF